jgi:histidinol phosphatase-like enzyme (inositol monophosphatase family)
MPATPPSPGPDRLAALDAFLITLNHASAKVILPLFRVDNGLQNKAEPGAFDPVTEADKGAERAIRALITEHYPDHGVIGEEYGEDRPDAEFVWVLDPIDGTRAFISGLPVWTTLIGLRFQGEPVLGSIGQPFTDELFIGHAGGSRLISRGSETTLKTRPCASLSDAVIATTDPAIFEGADRESWNNLRRGVRLARLGCDAYAYAMVAMGTMDLVVEARLKSWAGGLVTDWYGAKLGRNGGRVAIAGDPALLEQALATLSPSAT